jgi:hypothetical protein
MEPVLADASNGELPNRNPWGKLVEHGQRGRATMRGDLRYGSDVLNV